MIDVARIYSYLRAAAVVAIFLAACQPPDQEIDSATQEPTPLVTPTPALPAPPKPVHLIKITTGFNNPVGIDHHAATNQVIMSVNYSGGEPYNFELVSGDGTRTQFSEISGLSDEVKLTTVKPSTCMQTFIGGEMFTGTGVPGEIARIYPSGSPAYIPWVTLPNETGLMRGSFFQDQYCVFDGDLIVLTTAGNVWRITSEGVPTRLARVGTHLEGLTTVPDDPDKYGPWAGKILAGAEGEGCLYVIDAEGDYECYELGINPEDIDIIPAGQNFFGIDYGSKTLVGAKPEDFEDKVGDFLIIQEHPGIMFHVRWVKRTQSFEVNALTEVSQWEHVTFSTAGIKEVGAVDDTPPIQDCTPLDGLYTASASFEPLLLAPSSYDCNNVTTGTNFYEKYLVVDNIPDLPAVLSASPDGLDPIWVMDGMTFVTSNGIFYHTFSTDCLEAESCGPADVSSIFRPGQSDVRLELYNVCSPCMGNSPIFLVFME